MKKTILIEILIWTVILTVIFCGLIFSYSKIFIEPNVYKIQFKDIDGITKGSPVRFMGINVGYVRSLKSKDKYIDVKILITKKDMKLPNGTMARVEFYGLGGSKSIELMPPQKNISGGIVTEDNIRIADVVQKAESMVEIIEIIEKYVKGLNKTEVQGLLKRIKNTNLEKFNQASEEFNTLGKNMTKKVEEVTKKQASMTNTIKKVNDTVLEINKFIKK